MNISIPRGRIQRNSGIARLASSGNSGRTMLARLYQSGNAKIRVPARHDSKSLEAVMINIAGGMTGGDLLDWEFAAENGSTLTLTTQASEKVYKSTSGHSKADIRLRASDGSRINWLPQETILFDRARLVRTIELDLFDGSSALIVEPLVFGRQAMGETLEEAMIRDQWRVRSNGQMIHAEALEMTGALHDQLARKSITNGNSAIATVLLISPKAEKFLDDARKIIGESGGVSSWNGKLLARLGAVDGYLLRHTLVPLIRLLNDDAALPKSWSL